MRDQIWDDGSWLRTDQAAFFIHSLEKFHKIQINSNKFSRNSNKLGKIRIKLKQAVSKASLLWPYCWRKGAEQPDLQQCKLPVKEGSRATWRTIFLTVSQTVVGREQSNLMDNTICSCTDCCWKREKQPNGQHYLQLHRLLLEESKATWWTTLSAAAQTVVGRERSGLTST